MPANIIPMPETQCINCGWGAYACCLNCTKRLCATCLFWYHLQWCSTQKNMPEETKSDLPPNYQLHTKGKRITVSYLASGTQQYLDMYWLQENKARDAAWAHYRNLKKGLTSVE